MVKTFSSTFSISIIFIIVILNHRITCRRETSGPFEYQIPDSPFDHPRDPGYIHFCKGIVTRGRMLELTVDPCQLQPNGEPPCIFKKGGQLTVRGAYQAGASADDLEIQMRVKVGFFDKPYPNLAASEACTHQECPILEGDEYEFEYENLTVPLDFPTSRGLLKLNLVDSDTGESVVCGETTVEYKK